MDKMSFLFAAYMIIWALIGGYLLNIGGRLKKIEQK
ncbi:MAG: CcmD family protein [Deferribacteraceae bacterium]|jgi:CcmD family protein|nr:CcmD family protein [Deferribacteraceae bacterium]